MKSWFSRGIFFFHPGKPQNIFKSCWNPLGENSLETFPKSRGFEPKLLPPSLFPNSFSRLEKSQENLEWKGENRGGESRNSTEGEVRKFPFGIFRRNFVFSVPGILPLAPPLPQPCPFPPGFPTLSRLFLRKNPTKLLEFPFPARSRMGKRSQNPQQSQKTPKSRDLLLLASRGQRGGWKSSFSRDLNI